MPFCCFRVLLGGISWGGSMRLRTICLLLSALLLVGSFSSEGNAQTTTSGGLSGVVTDATHAVVPDANVEARDSTKGTTDSTKTSSDGVYQFPFLRPAKYVLSVTHTGFQEERRSVTVEVGPSVTVNITLRVATASSEITVTDEAPIIQAGNADVSTTMNQTQVSEVPNPGNDLTY